jgi:hypothetical protein
MNDNTKLWIHSLKFLDMTLPSEYTQIIAAGRYALALSYTVMEFRSTKILDQIMQITIIMAHLRVMDLASKDTLSI